MNTDTVFTGVARYFAARYRHVTRAGYVDCAAAVVKSCTACGIARYFAAAYFNDACRINRTCADRRVVVYATAVHLEEGQPKAIVLEREVLDIVPTFMNVAYVEGMKFVSDDVGRAVFFTREEAEKALAESMKKE